jgi:hypothetical protein
MLLVLIPIAWLAIVAIVVNACRAAAHGDELLAQVSSDGTHRDRASTARGASWHEGPALTGMRHIEHASAGRSQLRGVQGRRGRCATGS